MNTTPPSPTPQNLPLHLQLLLGLGILLLIIFASVGGPYYKELVCRMMILAIFAMSLDLLQGVCGLASLGHAAFFGISAYTLALLTPQDIPIALWWSMPLCTAVSALSALVVGFFTVRTKGIYFIMSSMAFGQMIYYFFFDSKTLGGSDGMYVNLKPSAQWIDLDNPTQFFYFTLCCLCLCFLFLRRLLNSPTGRVLSALRINEHRMQALGFNTFAYKLTAHTLGGALAGVAGYLWGVQSGYVNPELMGFHLSAHAIMMLVLGGMGTFAGAVIGAFSFTCLMEVFKDLPSIGNLDLARHWQLWMGLFIVTIMIIAPGGINAVLTRIFTKRGVDKTNANHSSPKEHFP